MIQSGPGWLAFRMFWKGFMFSSEYCEGRKSFEPVDTELKIIKNDYPSIMNLHKENPTYFTDLKLVILYAIGFTKIMLQENRIDDKNQNLDAVKKLLVIHGMHSATNGVSLQIRKVEDELENGQYQKKLDFLKKVSLRDSFTSTENDSFCLGSYHPFAKGIFTTTAMINHSCTPNVSLSYKNNVLHAAAVKNISAGEHLSINYGLALMDNQDLAARKKNLKERYGFDCCCAACDGDWPKSFGKSGKKQLAGKSTSKSEDLETSEEDMQKLGLCRKKCFEDVMVGDVEAAMSGIRVGLDLVEKRVAKNGMDEDSFNFVDMTPLVVDRWLEKVDFGQK